MSQTIRFGASFGVSQSYSYDSTVRRQLPLRQSAERADCGWLRFSQGVRKTALPRGGSFAHPVLQFTGKERDGETGLDYFGLRYMSTAQGRFTSPDPNSAGASLFDPQSWNAYSYTLNNPLKYVDPDGDVPIPVITGAVGAGVGAFVGGGAEALNQYLRTGTIQWGKVGTAALGGAISGGIAGATFGVGAGAGVGVAAYEAVAVNASSSVLGGIAQRSANEALGLDGPTDGSAELTSVALDAGSGIVGGIAGSKIADRIAPIPNVRREILILQNVNRRHRRPALIQAAQQNAQIQAGINSVVGGLVGGGKSEMMKSLWLWFTSPPPNKKEPKACVEVVDSATGRRSKQCE